MGLVMDCEVGKVDGYPFRHWRDVGSHSLKGDPKLISLARVGCRGITAQGLSRHRRECSYSATRESLECAAARVRLPSAIVVSLDPWTGFSGERTSPLTSIPSADGVEG